MCRITYSKLWAAMARSLCDTVNCLVGAWNFTAHLPPARPVPPRPCRTMFRRQVLAYRQRLAGLRIARLPATEPVRPERGRLSAHPASRKLATAISKLFVAVDP